MLRSWSMLMSCSISIGIVQGCCAAEYLDCTSAVASDYLCYVSTLFAWSVHTCSNCLEAIDLYCCRGLIVETLFCYKEVSPVVSSVCWPPVTDPE